MLKPRKIIRDYTPDYKALDTLDKQTKVIQDLYDQVNEFYRFISEPAFRAEIKGEKGPQGEQGERGHDGAKGDKGATGNPGPQGSTGPRGADGLPGLPGPTGPQGPEGIPGPEGPRGPRGYTGLQGPKGVDGAPGEKGDTGEKGDKGDKGDTGEKGDKGDTGDTGPQGETGAQGIPGKSSYQLAVDEGYQGTLEEFLNLIKEIYIGAGFTYSDIFIDANKYKNIKSSSTFNITTNNNKIIIIYPSTNTYVGVPKMNGMDIPMESSTFTDNDIVYNVLTSVNNYNDSFIITI